MMGVNWLLVVLCLLLSVSSVLCEPDMIRLRTATIDTNSQPALPENHASLFLQSESSSARRIYMVQLSEPNTPEKQNFVSNIIGHALTEYLPDNAYMIYTTASSAQQVLQQGRQLNHVRWVGEYLPQHKIAPELANHAQQSNDARLGINLLLAKGEAQRSLAEVTALAQNYKQQLNDGGVPEVEISPASATKITVRLPKQYFSSAIQILSQQHEVYWIEPIAQMRTMNVKPKLGNF